MKFSIVKTFLLITLTAWTITAAPHLSPRLSIGGNVTQTSVISAGGVNSAGVVGNIIDNSDNNGSISNTGHLRSHRPAARISIGGSGNSDNVIGANNGSGNIIDNSGNNGNLTNQGQNNNGGIVVSGAQ